VHATVVPGSIGIACSNRSLMSRSAGSTHAIGGAAGAGGDGCAG
jgi:hypothetical protein